MLSRLATRARVAARSSSARALSSSPLSSRLADMVAERQEDLKALKAAHGGKVVDKVTVNQVLGGARGVKCMLWETSLLDAEEGIRFRGLSIPEVQAQLPKADDGFEPLPEGLLWLLLTGEVPTAGQAASVKDELNRRAALPDGVEHFVRSLPTGMHPMTKFASGILALQQDSKFAAAYRDGAPKADYWKYTLEDVLDCIARVGQVAALIYRTSFKDGRMAEWDTSLDYSANFARQLGYTDKSFDDLMRLYLVIHSDHEGGNASAHATHLVGSTLSDPYLSLAGGMTALAGPLHGLANQEVLRWVLELHENFAAAGREVTPDSIREYAWATLNSGRVIPGYGHAVLRKTDPRFAAQREFALKVMPDDELVKIVSTVYEVVPEVLREHGKTANPWPNVDAHSGALLWHYGMREFDFYTVMFGVSRAYGVLSQLFWDRALGLPLERPKSVLPEWLWEQGRAQDAAAAAAEK